MNEDNIRMTLDLIERDSGPKRRFDMADWGRSLGPRTEDPEVCGTAMCFAGWAVIAAGGKLKSYQRTTGWGTYYNVEFVDSDGIRVSPSCFAEEWLGLPHDDIFYANVEDVHELRVKLKEMYGADV